MFLNIEILFKSKNFRCSDNSCAHDLLQTTDFASNATSGSTDNIKLGSTGWTATSATNQVVMFTFAGFMQVNVLRVQPVSSTSYLTQIHIFISNTTFVWTQYMDRNNNTLFSISYLGASVAYSLVLDPPAVTRFLRIEVRFFLLFL